MDKKSFLRKKYFLKRKKNYKNIDKFFFQPLINLTKTKFKKKHINISLYFPSNFELNILKIFKIEFFKKFNFALPVINKNNHMNFYKWTKLDILQLNKYGIPEPIKSKLVSPDIVLVPLLAFDIKKNRLGYGKGFYDRYLRNIKKVYPKILSIGVAFSFQKHHNLPINNQDFKLDYIITEKGII